MYGKYKLPKELIEFKNFEDELEKEGLSLEQLIFYFIEEEPNFYYPITPFDCIPFCTNYGDGTHYCFLTEFGQVENLSEAPIICVTPTNDPPIRLMARNIKEFIQLICSVPDMDQMESWWDSSEDKRKRDLQDLHESLDTETIDKRTEVISCIMKKFHVKPINYLKYIQQILEERKRLVTIPTFDGLGIIAEEQIINFERYTFQRELTDMEFERMNAYLSKANRYEKLAFIRDINYYHVITKQDNELFQLISRVLLDLGLTDEEKRLQRKDY